jgi:3-hydroxyisobutyrate dehydrogenase
MNNPKNIAFLGLGVMGGPMAAHLARAGHNVTGWNRTAARADAWRDRFSAEGLTVCSASSLRETVEGADVVLTCLGNDSDLAEVMLGDTGALAMMKPGTLYIDHTTVSPAITRRIAEQAQAKGILAVDAPVSGGQAGAENGKLSIMCGGSDEAMAAAEPVMQAYAARIVHIGKSGSGQATKAVNQVCIAGILAGLSEGVRLAQASHLDMDKVFEAISGGAAQSWQMDNRWHTMAAGEFDFGFAIDWMRKDLAIAMAEAETAGLELPVARLVDQYYAKVQEMGGSRQDTSALIRHLPEVGE